MAQQNPFKEGSTGENAFKAAYERLKAESERRMSGIQSQYGNLYQNLRSQQYAQGLGAAAQRGLSGGQMAGVTGRIGAQQMRALGDLSAQRQQAVLGENVNRSSIYSNALLEGQQAQQYETEQQQQALIRQQTINEIVNNDKLTDAEKEAQLAAYGVSPEEAANLSGQTESAMYGNIGGFSGITGIELGELLTEIRGYEKELSNSKSPAAQAAIRNKIITAMNDRIEELITLATNTGGSLTRQQAINRLRRRGFPVDQYGIR